MIPIGTKLEQITQEYLRTRLNYDAVTGDLIWLLAQSNRIGKVAGTIKCRSNGKPYIAIEINGKSYKAHRLVWLLQTGSFPTNPIEHKDDNDLNNRWDNLQESTLSVIKKDIELTQEQLKYRLNYDPIFGIFTWLITRWKKDIGKQAGYIANRRNKKYLSIDIYGKSYQAHRLVWLYVYGEWPKWEIDHINGDGLDNRIVNLRDVTHEVNGKNVKLHIVNSSGICGIHYCTRDKLWVAQINKNKKIIRLGSFKNKEDAISVRLSAEKELGYHANHGKERGN